MISKSVRNELNVIGQSASLKQLAHQNGLSFPVSVRNWVGALPPGRLVTKEIPLALLERKLNEFFNEQETPLFRLRLHGEEFGKSKLNVDFKRPVVGYQSLFEKEMHDLEFDTPFGNPDFHFNNLASERISVGIEFADWVRLAVRVDFETQNEEIKVNNFSNLNFTELNITLRFEIAPGGGAIDLLHWIENMESVDEATDFISTRVLVEAHSLPDGMVRKRVRNRINATIFEGLKNQEVRDFLKGLVTPWLIGGNFHVNKIDSNGASLFIEYVLPPGQLEPFEEVPQPALDPGRLANIDHIVVLMMENRSFDHMLGYLSKHGGRQDIDGLRGNEKNPHNGLDHFSFPLPGTEFVTGPCHDFACVFTQTNGGQMDGFVADFAPRARGAHINPGEVMGYHTAAQVPVYDALARQFLICQRWFAAHPGPTFPNRFYTLTGRLNRDVNGRWELDNPHGGTFMPSWSKNIFDHLSAQGVSWRYYEHGYSFLRMFARYTHDNQNINNFDNFISSAADGSLPAVSFIDPDFINVPPGNDDQPPCDIAFGQHLIGRVVQALTKGPRWGKTLLIITYDEHGGFYDHVPPPNAPAVSNVDRYGVRLPAFVISPWVDAGVSNVVFDHTSILKTIIRRFLSTHPPDMGARVAQANDLSQVLRTTPRADIPNIPVPPAPVINVAFAPNAAPPAEGVHDVNMLLRSMRSRYPV